MTSCVVSGGVSHQRRTSRLTAGSRADVVGSCVDAQRFARRDRSERVEPGPRRSGRVVLPPPESGGGEPLGLEVGGRVRMATWACINDTYKYVDPRTLDPQCCSRGGRPAEAPRGCTPTVATRPRDDTGAAGRHLGCPSHLLGRRRARRAKPVTQERRTPRGST